MSQESREQRALRLMSGEARGVGPALLRAGLLLAEPFYATGMTVRNKLYDRGIIRSYKLPRPVVSVGNLTTGGTGKTPVVRWLAEQFIARGLRPAILMRGYRSNETGGTSDEQRMLQNYLGLRATVIANPNRIAGAVAALKQAPQPDAFVLDDGFQHRRLRRDFNLLLINAAEPFGFGHVLPRGLLREPARGGMRRADAILVTRDDPARPLQIDPHVPVFRCTHVHAGLRRPGAASNNPPGVAMDELRRQKFFAFSGIAGPASLRKQFEQYGDTFVGFRAFGDHHAYTDADLASVRDEAMRLGATTLVTTEKDWVKLAPLPSAMIGLPILRLELRLEFFGDHEAKLLELIMAKVRPGASESGVTASPATTSAGSPGAAKAPGT
jgi:tetraacyldisaccharide 4'-kinase